MKKVSWQYHIKPRQCLGFISNFIGFKRLLWYYRYMIFFIIMEVYMSKYEIENIKLTAPKLDRNDLEYAMTYRYACKKFDSNKKISEEDWNAILNAARLSPTSLGFEAYQLLVIQNPEIREKMKAHGWGILAGLEASHVVVILARKKLILNSILHIFVIFKKRLNNYLLKLMQHTVRNMLNLLQVTLKPLSLNVLLLTGLQNKRISLWRI